MVAQYCHTGARGAGQPGQVRGQKSHLWARWEKHSEIFYCLNTGIRLTIANRQPISRVRLVGYSTQGEEGSRVNIDNLIKSGRAARELEVSPQTLANWAKKWPYEKVGPEPLYVDGQRFYCEQDVADHKQERE